jgi:hypothetical protein
MTFVQQIRHIVVNTLHATVSSYSQLELRLAHKHLQFLTSAGLESGGQLATTSMKRQKNAINVPANIKL